MARWLVPLSGNRFDLEQFPRWFPNGEVFAIEENGAFFLVGPAFEILNDTDEVFELASSMLGYFTTSIDLVSPGIRRPIIHHPIEKTDEGVRDLYVQVSDDIRIRDDAYAAIFPGADSTKPKKTQAQEILDHVSGNSHLEEAFTVWSELGLNWIRLRRILEAVELHLGMEVNQAGLCSRSERKRFARTANTAESAGLDAAHASGQFTPPANPMTLEEGIRFVRGLLRSVSQ